MQKLLIGMAVSGCFEQAGEHGSAGSGATQQQPGKINATYLQNHFIETTGAETTRLGVLLASLKASTQKEVNEAVRDWSNSYKPTASKGTPEYKAQMAKRQVIQTRGGEVKTIKAALDTGFIPEQGKGYHPTVSMARATLAQKGLNNGGKPVVEPEVRKQAQQRRMEVDAIVKLENAGKAGNKSFDEVRAEAQVEVQRETARKLGNVIVQRHGVTVAMYVAEYLTQEAQNIAQAAADAQAAAKQEDGEQQTPLTDDQQAAKDAQNGVQVPQAAAA